jgi:hypothetical protein
MDLTQIAELYEGLSTSLVRAFHHGDCVGGDAQAHDLARMLGLWIVTHPPVNPGLRAFREGGESRPPKPYLARNADIVQQTDLLLAAPAGPETPRSGTWWTIRYAHSLNKRVVILGLADPLRVVGEPVGDEPENVSHLFGRALATGPQNDGAVIANGDLK